MSATPLQEVLREVVDRRVDRAQRLVPTLVTGRNTDGTLKEQLWGEAACVRRGCVGPEGTGALVLRDANCQQSTGATGVATVFGSSTGRALWLESIEPSVFEQGQSYTVVVTGLGFDATVRVDFLLPGGEDLHEGITVVETRFVDHRTLELDIEVAADAALVDPAVRAPLGYGAGAA